MRFISLISLVIVVCGCQPGAGEFSEVSEIPVSSDRVNLETIQETIFTPICAQCHIGSQAPLGLRLESAQISFEHLVGVQAVGNTVFERVTAFEPDESFLMLKLLGDPLAGQRMPLGLSPLSSEQIELIRGWIAQGALAAGSKRTVSILKTYVTGNDKSVITIQIEFDGRLNDSDLPQQSISIYQNYFGERYLLAPHDYEILKNDPSILRIEIRKSVLFSSQLIINIGEPTSAPLLDHLGNPIDGNKNGSYGGVYETTVEGY